MEELQLRILVISENRGWTLEEYKRMSLWEFDEWWKRYRQIEKEKIKQQEKAMKAARRK